MKRAICFHLLFLVVTLLLVHGIARGDEGEEIQRPGPSDPDEAMAAAPDGPLRSLLGSHGWSG
jgi:hypothetical protein